MNPTHPQLNRYFLIAAVLQIVWGITPSASRFVIEEIPVELYITIRWTISGLIFAAYLLLTRNWKPIGFLDFVAISCLGLLGYGVASFGTLYGLKLGGVANFAFMATLGPIITTLASVCILKERPKKSFALSLGLSILGLGFVLAGKYQGSTFSIAGASALLIVLAYGCEAVVFVYSKKFKQKVDGAQYLAIAQISTAVFMWGLQGTAFHQTSEILNLSPKGMAGIVFVSLVACVLCYAVLYWLLNHVDGHKLALFDGLHTLSAVVFGYVFFLEPIRGLMVFGGALMLLSLILGTLAEGKGQPRSS